MKASMVLAAALATGLLGSFRVVAEAAPACRGGRFLVEGPPLIGATLNGEPDAVVIDGIRVSLTSGCGATSGRIRVAKRGTKVNAVWPSCGGLRGKARLKARIDPTCKTMTGTLRARREKWKRSFSAKLSECGDGIVDIDGGEECEPPGSVACDDRCQLVNGSPPTTTTTVTFATTTSVNFTTTTTTTMAPPPTTSSTTTTTTTTTLTTTSTTGPPTTSTSSTSSTTSSTTTTTTPSTSSTTSTTVPICGTFVTTWGSSGAGNGQFNAPLGVATDGSGNVYGAASGNNRVQKFDTSGNFLTAWRSWGSGNGQFIYPSGLAVDGSGNVYVADRDNNRIQKFDASGTFLTTWGSAGSGNGQFSNPTGVATDGSGNVYVVDGNNRIQTFDANGAFLTTWGSFGYSGNGQF